MKKAVWSAMAAVAVLACADVAQAQTTHATANITASVAIGTRAQLTLSGNVSFPDMDPDAFATVPAAAIDVSARARVAPGTQMLVTVLAERQYFDAGTSTIPVANVSWTGTGGAYMPNGTLNHLTAQNVASWTGPAQQNGTQTYALQNLWSYAPGNYSMLLTYTLVTP